MSDSVGIHFPKEMKNATVSGHRRDGIVIKPSRLIHCCMWYPKGSKPLGGSSKTTKAVAVSPSVHHYAE